MAAILPWSFLQADYAQNLRYVLFEKFNRIKALALTAKYFENADERVVLLWLNGYGRRCESIKMGSSKSLKREINYSVLPLSNWSSSKVLYNGNTNTESILLRYKNEFGFTEFENHADVKIGIVTGADKYFIISKSKAKELGFEPRHLVPIFTRSHEMYASRKDIDNIGRLIYLTRKNYNKFKSFIDQGKLNEYHLRVHSSLREPWYQVKMGNMPDGFFPYRASKFPYLIRNIHKVQCTNSIHRIYFKQLSVREIKWIQVSLLSAAGQLSIEANSKTYGRGILKIEPGSLKRTLVLKKTDPKIDDVYLKLEKLLLQNDRLGAMKIATYFINKELNIPSELSNAAETILYDFQNHRFYL